MSKSAPMQFQPRKTPVQARSTESVEAILQATVQVLLQAGRTRLTTTRVAERAGVSVGTLYQYFPNKSALLQALLQRHLDGVADAIEAACLAVSGKSLKQMAEAVTSAFVEAKFHNIDVSVSLYAMSGDVEGKRIAQQMRVRATRAIAAMLQTSQRGAIAEPAVVAETLLSAMAGVSRSMLESGVKPGTMSAMRRELTVMATAYLKASAAR